MIRYVLCSDCGRPFRVDGLTDPHRPVCPECERRAA